MATAIKATKVTHPITHGEFISHFTRHRSGGGVMSYIETASGKFKVSAVAGEYYYSTPREDNRRPNEYSSMEIAIMDERGDWASYKQLKEAGAFDIVGTGEYSEDGGNCCVFGWVPVDKIVELINAI